MKAIYNMQTRCQELNDCISTYYTFYKQDYCKITDFDGLDIFYAIKCTRILGYSGLISFNNLSISRTFTPVFLYQIQENQMSQVIAKFDENITFYNNEYFPGGDIPKSGKFCIINTEYNTYILLHMYYSRKR